MNREQFTGLLKDPSLTNAQTIRSIEEVVKRYPCCQSAHLLLAVNLYREENLQYPVQLRKAAAYAPDRRILKALIETSHVPSVPGTLIQEPPEDKTANTPHPGEEHVVADGPVTVKMEAYRSEPENTITAPAGPESHHPETKDVTALLPTEETPAWAPEAGTARVPEDDKPAIGMAGRESGRPPEVHDKMTQKELLFVVKKRLAGLAMRNEPHNMMPVPDSLHDKNDKGPASDTGQAGSARELAEKERLIDKFIREEPRITKPGTPFFHPSESALRSNFDEEEIVSETLAQLYARQGNIRKATHIYEKLSLLNQEKSRYFAAQIEKLGLNP